MAIIPDSFKIHELEEPDTWYSQPIVDNGQILFIFLDNDHLLTKMRRKCCTTEMPKAGIRREAWVKVAKEHKTNGTGLTLAQVDDLIDKQSCAFALLTFSEKVENEMIRNGDVNEAIFVRYIREWYEAEDQPGLSQRDRILRRLRLRKWLLRCVEFDNFTPSGSHIKEIQVVLFEGLLTSIDRHLQLFPFVANHAYNAKAIGTLDIESYFAEFTELDPKGTDVLRPDDVKVALSSSCEVLHSRMDQNR